MAIKRYIIPRTKRIKDSCGKILVPFKNIPLIICRKCVAGIIFETHCNQPGMFSTGNIKPDRIIDGSIVEINEVVTAVSSVVAYAEIIVPRARVGKRKSNE